MATNDYTKITGNGLVGNAVHTTNSTKLGMKVTGDLDGGTVAFSEWYGDGTPDVSASEWAVFATFTSASVGSAGLEYTIGMDTPYKIDVSGAGSPDAYVKAWDILR